MTQRAPLILVSPSISPAGEEFADRSLSLSENYTRAIAAAGGIPLVLPGGVSKDVVEASVSRCDGVLLTGGDDIEPKLYANGLPPSVRKTVHTSPDGGERDLRELLVIDAVFRQRKPFLGICRGHQLLNVALGGTLVADIPRQVPGAIKHGRMDLRNKVAHDVQLTEGSLIAKITGRQALGVNSTHHQAVGRLAEPLRAVAVCEDGIVEGTELKPEASGMLPFLLTVQFHPERLAERYREHQAIFRAFIQACHCNKI